MNTLDFDKILALKPRSDSINVNLSDNNPIILYGAGIRGEFCLKYLQQYNVKPVAICDTFKVGQEYLGYKLCSVEDIINKYENPKIIITSVRFYEEIKSKLLEYFPKKALVLFTNYDNLEEYRSFIQNNKSELNRIFDTLDDEKSKQTFINILKGRVTADNEWTLKAYEPNQYFATGIIALNHNESFVDGGAFVGDTTEIFIEQTMNQFNQIYCFEPSESNYGKLSETKKKYNDDDRITLFKAGLYSNNKKLGFYDSSISPVNAITEEYTDKNTIDVVSMDRVIKDEVTFIKMDIEGAELEALKGAKEIILKYKPKLAISVYHKNEDLIDIPNYILSLGLDYRYYLRHHYQYGLDETVFYAV